MLSSGNGARYFFTFSLILAFFNCSCDGLVCYACTATLSSAIDPQGQVALRVFLDATYNLPQVHRLCNMENDVEFKTVPTAQCSNSDNCMKITAESHGIVFVIRGCQSHIYKPNVGVQSIGCQSHKSPSICYCAENLCNPSSTISISFKILTLALFSITLINKLLF